MQHKGIFIFGIAGLLILIFVLYFYVSYYPATHINLEGNQSRFICEWERISSSSSSDKSLLTVHSVKDIELPLTREMLSTVKDVGIIKVGNQTTIGISTLRMDSGYWVIEKSSADTAIGTDGDFHRFVYVIEAHEAKNWEIQNEKVIIFILILSILSINLLVAPIAEKL